MKYFYLTLTALFMTGAVVAQNISFKHEGWEGIKKEAVKKDKIIFVDAFTTWCGPCKWMSAEVFTDENVADFYNDNFINVKLDMEKGEGIDFAAEYNVNAYPTLLFIDGEGDIVHKRLGAIPADMFVEFGKEALDPAKRIGTLIKKYDKGNRDPEFLQQYVTKLVAAGMSPQDAADEYFASLNTADMVTAENFNLIRMLRPTMDHAQFKTVVENQKAFSTLVGEDQVNAFVKETCNTDLMRALYYDGDEAFAKTVAKIEATNMDFTDEVVTYGYMSQARKNHDYPQFISNTKKYSKKYAWDKWDVLNGLAWDIYEDEENDSKKYLKLGTKLAKQSVKLDKNYYNADTYAAMLYRSGKYKPALEWGNEAIKLAKSSEMDYEDTSTLIAKIKKAMTP